MTTASKITMIRVALLPVFILVMIFDFPGSWLAALLCYALACVTDFVDGYVARHYNQVSDFGKFADPLADKLLVMAALIFFVQWGQMPAWSVIVILAREFAVTGLRLIAVENGRVIAAGWSGKTKTMASMVAICVMLTPLHSLCLGPAWLTLDFIGWVLMLLTTVYSGTEYFVKNWDALNLKNTK